MVDIAQLAAALPPWGGAPTLPILPKSQTNVTATSIPRAQTPALSSPGEMLGAAAAMQNAHTQAQQGALNAQMLSQRLALMKAFPDQLNKLMAALGQGQSVNASTNDAASPAASNGSTPSPAGNSAASASQSGDPLDGYADRVTQLESGGDPNAKNPNSSATGPGQFLNSTWLSVAKSHFPETAQMGDQALLDLRKDPDFSRSMIKAYAADNAQALGSAGIPTTPGNLYAAHFLGAGGATKVLSADPGTPMSSLLSPEVIAANPNLKGMTAGNFAANMALKMSGGKTPTPIQFAQNDQGSTGEDSPPSPAPMFTGPNAAANTRFMQQVQAAQKGTSSPGTPQMAPQLMQGGQLDPRLLALAGFGAQSELVGLPNIAAPFMSAIQNSPGYKGQVAGAERTAQNASDLQYAAPIAGAKKKAELPYTFGRPGGALPQVDANGNPTGQFIGVPQLQQVTDPATGQKSYAYLSPQGVRPTGQVAGLGPGQAKTLENNAAVQPLTLQTPITKSGPGYTEPLKSDAGTTIPPAIAATPIQGPKEYLDDRAKEYSKVESAWGDSVQSATEAQQRMTAIMSALKQYQSGAFASDLSDVRAGLKAVGINLTDAVAGNPAQAEIILKNNFAAAIQTMKATGLSRWTQAELFSSQKNMANPDLQPEANLAIGAQTIGTLQWEQQMQRDYMQAKKYGGFLDPQDFQRQWAQANPLQAFVDRAEQQIGPLKGMQQPQNVSPAGPRRLIWNPRTKTLDPMPLGTNQ